MNKAMRYRMSQDVVKIRRLQLEKARSQALRAQQEATHAEEARGRAEQTVQSCASSAKHALENRDSLSLPLITAWLQATQMARHQLHQCSEAADLARNKMRAHALALQQHHEQQNDAHRLADRARRDYEKRLEEKRYSAIEDRYVKQRAKG